MGRAPAVLGILLVAAVLAGAQDRALGRRDLQEMFYADTLPRAKPVTRKPANAAAEPAPKKAEPAAETDQSARRVGIRFRIQQRDQDGTVRDVDTTTVFHSGDRVRFEVESNIDGYLYVIQKGSSGAVSTLFPDAAINQGTNTARRGMRYPVPGDEWFAFDQTPGEEHVMLILSRSPLKSLPAAKLSARPEAATFPALLDELDRCVQSRDLMLYSETTPAASAAAAGVASVVVNTSSENNEVVYTEVVLKHQ
jgi:hypothetical protein